MQCFLTFGSIVDQESWSLVTQLELSFFFGVEFSRRLPGGFVECGDNHVNTALKETMEEAGLQVKLMGLLAIQSCLVRFLILVLSC